MTIFQKDELELEAKHGCDNADIDWLFILSSIKILIVTSCLIVTATLAHADNCYIWPKGSNGWADCKDQANDMTQRQQRLDNINNAAQANMATEQLTAAILDAKTYKVQVNETPVWTPIQENWNKQ